MTDAELLAVKRAVARYPGVSSETLWTLTAPPAGVERAAWRTMLDDGLAELLKRGEVRRTQATSESVRRWWPVRYEIPELAGSEV